MMIENDEKYLKLAIIEAKKAQRKGEVPVGAIITVADKVIARAHNQSIGKNDPSAHAEILALRKAARAIGNYRLEEATLYVTIEPCAMCSGAILNAHIKRLVFGAYEPKSGCVFSKAQLLEAGLFNHDVEISGGIMQEECAALLSRFFQQKRLAARRR